MPNKNLTDATDNKVGKMTDNEIIKALEQRIKDLPCVHEKYEPACGMWCEHLHMWCIDFNNKSLKEKCSEYKPCCSMSLEKQALSLINRQEAEIEQLAKEKENLAYSFANAVGQKMTAKAEAYKEFAERLKEIAYLNSEGEIIVFGEDIDNLLKEMVGENDES